MALESLLSKIRNWGVVKRVLPMALAGALYSCGTDDSCQWDSDCASNQVCEEQVCVDPSGEGEGEPDQIWAEPFLDTYKKASINDSEHTINVAGHEIPISVKDTDGKGILYTSIDAIADAKGAMIAVQKRGEYLPQVQTVSFDHIESNLTSETLRQSLFYPSLTFILEVIENGLEIKKIAGDYDPGRFLGENDRVNKYCVTLEQMEENTIGIPSGIVFLAPKAAGLDTELLQVGINSTLKHVFRNWIYQHHGEQPGYEVWIPKTALTLEANENEVITTIDTNRLTSSLMDMDVPIWEVRGGCVPDGYVEPGCTPTVTEYVCGVEGNRAAIFIQDDCDRYELSQLCEPNQFCNENLACEDRRDCIDECESSICVGERSYQACDDFDHDGCTEYAPEAECWNNGVCAPGGGGNITCTPDCNDECETPFCLDDQVVNCRDYDGDGCKEAGEPVQCLEAICVEYGQAPFATCEAIEGCTDLDRDNYGNGCDLGPDCDDTNPLRNPGRQEQLNGYDDNCNGQIDEGFINQGRPQITLMWDSPHDLDLYVTDPSDCTISYSRTRCGEGRLDRDALPQCDNSAQPPENIIWPVGTAQRGTYRVEVDMFTDCNQDAPASYIVGLTVNGQSSTYEGAISADEPRKLITTFEVD